MAKYLDSSGLSQLWTAAKNTFASSTHTHNYAGSDSAGGGAYSLISSGFAHSRLTYKQTSVEFDANSGWCHYIIANHGDGETYYHYTIGLPFWGIPKYTRLHDGVRDGWFNFITDENISSQSVSSASTSGKLTLTRPNGEDSAVPENDRLALYYSNTSASGNDGYILTMTTDDYAAQLFIDVDQTYKMSLRQKTKYVTWNSWVPIITGNNIGSQSVSYADSAGSAASATNASKLGNLGPTSYVRHVENPIRDVTIDANELTQANTLYTSAGDMNSGNVTSEQWLNFPTPRPDGGYFLLNITENSAYKRQIYGRYSDNHLWVRGSGWNSSGNFFKDWSKIALTTDNVASADYATSAGSVAWGNITGKPSTFVPSTHTHSDYCIKNSTIQVANIDIGGTTNGIVGTPYSSGDQNKYNFIRFSNANSDGGLIYTAGTWTSGDHIAHRFVVANIDPAMVIRNATGYVGIGVEAPDTRLHVNGDVKASKFIKSGCSDNVVLLGAGGDRAISNFFYSSRDYLFHNVTLTYNVWKRVLEVNNTSGNGTNILFSVQCHHSNDVKSVTWLLTFTLSGGVTITELSGNQYSNQLSIRVTSDNSYYYTTYIDLKKLSSSQTSAGYNIKVIKLTPNGQDLVAKDIDEAEALTYSLEKQAGETRIPTDGKMINSEIDAIMV